MGMRLTVGVVTALLLAPPIAVAQHEGHSEPQGDHAQAGAHAGIEAAAAPLDVPPSREGSGTSWLPDDSPMYMLAWQAGPWELDAMWNVFLQYLDDGGKRGR